MAQSPAHKFGQELGKLLEEIVLEKILKPRLIKFVQAKNYYLDWQHDRPARQGKKVTWSDKYGNKHDLDFVIEVDGTEEKLGQPVAFIECAWRRYTKHSKNKAQEIQGAILPIVEFYGLSAPFYGVILAGEFTRPALEQLQNNGFSIIYIPYKDIVSAFQKIGLDIEFAEGTKDFTYTNALKKISLLSPTIKEKLKEKLAEVASENINKFMNTLERTLERNIAKILIISLFGKKYTFKTAQECLLGFEKLSLDDNIDVKFEKFEIIIDYSNGDSIRANFKNKTDLHNFLLKL